MCSSGKSIMLDGDALRETLHSDLDFSKWDRAENVFRTARLAKFLALQGHLVIVSLMTPRSAMRQLVIENICNADIDLEMIYCDCSLADCARRDAKGLYAKHGDLGRFEDSTVEESVLAGTIKNFAFTKIPTGIHTEIKLSRVDAKSYLGPYCYDFGAAP